MLSMKTKRSKYRQILKTGNGGRNACIFAPQLLPSAPKKMNQLSCFHPLAAGYGPRRK